jgi:hypothetical protein
MKILLYLTSKWTLCTLIELLDLTYTLVAQFDELLV